MALRTPQQAVDYAMSHLNTGYNGYCLMHVQDAYGAKAVYPSAISAWQNSRYQHPTTDLASAPYGAPICWSQAGNPYGHIAIHLNGDQMYTTDSSAGHPHTDSIAKWQNQYGYRPLGWTEDVENQLIPELLPEEDDMPSANEVAQAVWGFRASDGKNLQPGGNPYETLKTAGQVGGFAFTVDDDEHNNGNTVYWLNTSTMKYRGYGTWDEWTVWCKLMHCPTDKYAKLTSKEFESLKDFLDRGEESLAPKKPATKKTTTKRSVAKEAKA